MNRHDAQIDAPLPFAEPYGSRFEAMIADVVKASPSERLSVFKERYAEAVKWPSADVDYFNVVDGFYSHALEAGLADDIGEGNLRDVMQNVEESISAIRMAEAAARKHTKRHRGQTPVASATRPAMIQEIEWFNNVAPALESPYLIKSLLDKTAMAVLYGPSNSGKTFFALDLAFHVAAGVAWRKRKVNGGVVLYLAAEGGNGIANRIVGLRSNLAEGVTVKLALRRAGLDLLNPDADVQRLISLVREIEIAHGPVVLIVIDTLSRVLAGGDENGPADMTAFVKNVDTVRLATGAHVMIVHHTGKDAARGARGHSSLRAATDTEIEISVDDAGNRSASVTKQRDHAGGENFYFGLDKVHLGFDQDGDEVSTCILAEADQPAAGDGTPSMSVCKLMLKEIDEAWTAGNPFSSAHQAKNTGRFVVRYLSQKYDVPYRSIERLIAGWLDNEIVITEIVDRKSKKAGLRVKTWL